MRYDATTFELPGAARREAIADRTAAAKATLATVRERGLAAIDDAIGLLIGDADLALAPVDGSSGALDELRDLRKHLLVQVSDALHAVEAEIDRRHDSAMEDA